MRGQWIGAFRGTSEGVAIIELDDVGNHWEGSAFAYSSTPSQPSLWAHVRAPKNVSTFDLNLHVKPIEGPNGQIEEWNQVKAKYPGVELSPDLNTKWEYSHGKLNLSWQTPIGTAGSAELAASRASAPSERIPEPNIVSWAAFKEHTISLEPRRYVFRGHESNKWRLRTYFHRCGRFDLLKFVNADIPQLHTHLSSITSHHFKLGDPLENAAFHSLVQHHGYPTPLLDWTFSPYIAAFFAFRRLSKAAQRSDAFARIYMHDLREWNSDHPKVQLISPAPLHFTFLNPLAINNPRLMPQQALSSVTNLDDIEEFIGWQERRTAKKYLRVVDLPTSERGQIMQELAMMGITAGALFPGLDGACEQMREQYFDL
ncbi:FRG domain-containing protein [Bradyrhizobium sp.]|uniref:FRG domain-containing protein n=1 Tax=Bradyrhizobium sp. TaxID=376 RepID=UPI00403773F8